MGWASGSEIAERTWDLVREYIPEGVREGIAREFIEPFEDADCDTIYECEQLVKDAGLEDEYWPDDDE